MNVALYHGVGEIRDQNDGNIHSISISLSLQPGLRTWHAGKPLLGEIVPIALGEELPPNQYQFVIRESSAKIGAINYSFWGEKGYFYAEKIPGTPLMFQEWSLSKIRLAGGNPEEIFSHHAPTFHYLDGTVWDCYASPVADCPEYGQLAPVIDLSTNSLDFKEKNIPPVYANGARLDLKIHLQTFFNVI